MGKPLRQDGAPGVRFALFLTISLRLLYSGMAALFVPYLRLKPELIHANNFTDHLIPRTDALRYILLGVWERFDTLWYIHIAANGYDRPDGVVFYPLYPALIRVTSVITRNPLVAALALSTVSFFFLLWGLQKLLSLDLPPAAVRGAVLLCGLWPAGFIFLAGYTESLVLALIVWSVYFARTDRWWLAGVLGFFGGLTKAVGVLSFVPMAVIALRKKTWRAWPAVLCLVGPALFLAYLDARGLPWPSDIYEISWSTTIAWPWVTLAGSVHQALHLHDPRLVLNLSIFLVTFLLAFLKNIRIEYLAYCAAALCFLLLKKSAPDQQQWARYVLIIFPAYANLGQFLEDTPWLSACGLVLLLVNALLMFAFLEWALVV